MVFVLCANVNLIPYRYDDWQAAYDKLAEHVYANEQNTKAYYCKVGLPIQFWTNHSAATHMWAFEIYSTREDLYETHLKSPAMTEFLSAISPTMNTGLDLAHYEDKSGFLDRFSDRRECEIMVDVRIICQPGTRDDILRRLAQVAKRVHEDLEGTYTFLVLSSLDSQKGVRIFQRFRSWLDKSSCESHKAVLEFWQSSKEQVISMENQCYVPNRKGWLHRNGVEARSRL